MNSTNGVGMIASIGRDTVTFALGAAERRGALHSIRTMAVRDYSTFTAAIEAFLADALPGEMPQHAAIAIAGVPVGDVVNVSGGSWYLSIRGLESFLGTRPVVLNDFAASIFALPRLPATALRAVGASAPAVSPARGTIALVGPLGGLGTAGLILLGGDRAVAVQSEAGNSGMAMTSEDQRLFQQAMERLHGRFVPEHLLSEGGLLAAFDLFAGGRGQPRPGQTAVRTVSQAHSTDPIARRALNLFLQSLGDYCRMVLMTLGAWNGLYLCGPLAHAIATDLAGPVFRTALENGGRYRRRLADVPVTIVIEDHLDLIGAAAALASEVSLNEGGGIGSV